MHDERTEISVRVVDESRNPWPIDIGARYLLDLRAVMYTGFRIGWYEGAEASGNGWLVQRSELAPTARGVLLFAASPRDPDGVVPWESNLVYATDRESPLGEVVVGTSAAMFERLDRTLRSGDNQVVQVDLITFHDVGGEAIRLPHNVRGSYTEQMHTVNGYRNCASAAEALERYGVDRTIEEHFLSDADAICVTLHVIAPFLPDHWDEKSSRSVAVPGPPVNGDAILRIVLTYDIARVCGRLSDYHRELGKETPDPGVLERLDTELMELMWERFVWADTSEHGIEDLLTSTSPLVTT